MYSFYCVIQSRYDLDCDGIDQTMVMQVMGVLANYDYWFTKCIRPKYLSNGPDRDSPCTKKVDQHQVASSNIGAVSIEDLLAVHPLPVPARLVELLFARDRHVNSVSSWIDSRYVWSEPLTNVASPTRLFLQGCNR